MGSEKLSIVITTYDNGSGNRTGCLGTTVKYLYTNLDKTALDLLWVLADDGSPDQKTHLAESVYFLTEKNQQFLITDAKREGVGKSKNIALEKAFEFSDYVLLTEDDWQANHSFDLYAYIKILEQHEEIGMIRLGYLGGDIVAKLVSYNDITFWELVSGMYVYSGQISLRSRRNFYDKIGYHTEGLAAGAEEENLVHRYGDMTNKPKILFPAQYGTTLNAVGGLFTNIGMGFSLNNIQPGT